MKKYILLIQLSFLFGWGLSSQNLCNKNIIVWNFNIKNDNKVLAKQISGEVEQAIIQTNKPIVVERNNYNELIGILQNEENLCNCPSDLVDQTVVQLKKYSANEVVFGEIKRDVYDNRFELKLTFTNLNRITKDDDITIHFLPDEFEDKLKRERIIRKRIDEVFSCDKDAEELEQIITEINVAEKNLENLKSKLKIEYGKRDVADEILLNTKKNRRDYSHIKEIHLSIKSLKNQIKVKEENLELKKEKKARLIKIQRNKQLEEKESVKEEHVLDPKGKTPEIKIVEKKGEVRVSYRKGGIVRSNPNKRSKQVASFKEGDVIQLTGKKSEEPDTHEFSGEDVTDYWYQVQYDMKRRGWIFGGAIENYSF